MSAPAEPPPTGPPAIAEAATRPFAVVPVVNAEYVHEGWSDLDGVEEEARRIGELLADWGGILEPWEVGSGERDRTRVEDRLIAWADTGSSRSSVLLWLGHGAGNEDQAYLVVRGGSRGKDHEVSPEWLAGHIVDEHRGREQPDWAIVVIEACGAARFAEQVGAVLHQRRALNGILVVGCGAAQGRGYLGTFRRALSSVRDTYFINDTRISLGDLSNRLDEELDAGYVVRGTFRHSAPIVPIRPITQNLTTPIDVYQDLRGLIERLPVPERLYFAQRGTGADLLEFSWHFAGRNVERAAILDWFRTHEGGLLAFIGPPGCGKSALLGNLLLHARPDIRDLLSQAGSLGNTWPDAAELPEIDGSLLLTGLDTHQVICALAAIADVPLRGDALSVTERANALLAALGMRDKPLTVLADALDEAQDPAEIGVLLSRAAALPAVRIVLATRPAPAGDGPGTAGLDLLTTAARQAGHVSLLRIERDEAAMVEFARNRLRAADVPQPEADRAVADVAAVLTDGGRPASDREFLHARLLVRELLAEPRLLLDEARPARLRLLDFDSPGLFRLAVERITASLAAAQAFLRALAFARGRGLPRADRIWSIVAEALDPGSRFTDNDLQEVLDEAGPYIMLDAEHGHSVFRLAHRTFAEQILAAPRAAAEQLAVLEALLAAAGTLPELPPYLRSHLSGHALAAGPDGWTALSGHPDVIDQLDLRALLSDAWRVPGGLAQLPAPIAGACITAHLAVRSDSRDRRGLRQLGMARIAGVWDAPGRRARGSGQEQRIPPGPAGTFSWEVRRAKLTRHAYHLTLGEHSAAVRGLAVVPGRAADVILASGDDAGNVRLWIPTGARAIEVPLAGNGYREVLGMIAATSARGEAQVVSAGNEQPLRIWDPATGDLLASLTAEWPEADQAVTSLIRPDGSVLIAVGGSRGTLRLWDLDKRERVGRDMRGHTGLVTALGVVAGSTGHTADAGAPVGLGRDLLASAGRDRTLRLWDPVTCRPVGEPRVGHETPIRALAYQRRAGLIATGSDDGQVVCWLPDQAEPVLRFTAHHGEVLALAEIPGVSGVPLLASGGSDGVVRIWEARSGHQVGSDLTAAGGPVNCLVAFLAGAGGIRLAAGADDGTIRIWSLGSGPASAAPGIQASASAAVASPQPLREWSLTGARGETVAVTYRDGIVSCRAGTGPAVQLGNRQAGAIRCAAACGDRDRSLVATAGHDAIVRTWDAFSGRQEGPWLRGHTDWVGALTWLTTRDGPPLLVSGGDDQTLCFWEPRTGRLLHRIRFGAPIRSLEAADHDLHIGIDQGEVTIRPLAGLLADVPEGGEQGAGD